MKKNILTISFVLMMGSLCAQTIIPRAGVTFSNSSFEPIGFTGEKSKGSSVAGFTVGVGYEHKFNEKFSIQPEVNFIQKGQKLEEVAYPDGYEYKINTEVKFNYLEVPVLAKYKFGGQTKFYVAAGPSVGLGLGGKYSRTSSFGGVPEPGMDGKIKFSDQPNDYSGDDIYVENKFDISLQVGGGVILFNKLLVDIRYGHGFTDLVDDENSKNRSLQLSVGMPISLL